MGSEPETDIEHCPRPGWHCCWWRCLWSPDTDHGMQMLGPHPRERGSRWSSVFCYSRYLFFCPPLCGIMIRTDCTIQNKEDIQNIFHLTLQTMFFIDLLPPTTLLMLFLSPLLNPYLCLNRWIRFVWPPKVIWSWHFVISDIRIKWDILATEWWMTIPPDKNRSQISLKYLLIF